MFADTKFPLRSIQRGQISKENLKYQHSIMGEGARLCKDFQKRINKNAVQETFGKNHPIITSGRK